MTTAPRGASRPDGAATEPAEPARDVVVRIGWKVAPGYRGLPTVRHVVTDWGDVVAVVHYVVLPAPAWGRAEPHGRGA